MNPKPFELSLVARSREKRTKAIYVRLTEEEWNRADAVAAKMSLSLSDLVRHGLTLVLQAVAEREAAQRTARKSSKRKHT